VKRRPQCWRGQRRIRDRLRTGPYECSGLVPSLCVDVECVRLQHRHSE
jgi:hypothetical protein